MKRCFISIDIPEEFYGEIKKIQDCLPEFKGKKTEPENLHLTLKFLGEVDEEKIKEVKERLREVKFERFETELKYAGFFDNKKEGIVWLYLTNCEGLQRKVDEALLGEFKSEYRFMGHLTIARIKYVENKEKFMESLKNLKIPKLKFVVDNFRLKESILTAEGPVYKTIEEYGLD